MEKQDWVWMPHPAHFICADRCQFRLATYVGNYIVSTVGEMTKRDNPYEWDEVGCERKYETMVFKAQSTDCECCPFEIDVSEERDMAAYNDAPSAFKGHMEMCKKWSQET